MNRQEIGQHPYFWWQWVVSGPVVYPEDLKEKVRGNIERNISRLKIQHMCTKG
jgi:hypothetical protein